MSTPLEQILSQLDQYYAPQTQAYQSQLDALPGQQQMAQQGLDQAKTNAFGDITAGANSRGVLYSGIPIAEQGKYVGSTYLPAVANLQQSTGDKRSALQTSIAQVKQNQAQNAYDIYQKQQAQEQAAALAQQAANRSVSTRSSGGSSSSKAAAPTGPVNYNSNSVSSWVNYIHQNYHGQSWGAIAKDIEGQGGKIPGGTNLDQALHYIFTGVY